MMLWPMVLALTNGSGPKDLDVAKTEKIAMAAQDCTIMVEYKRLFSKAQIEGYLPGIIGGYQSGFIAQYLALC